MLFLLSPAKTLDYDTPVRPAVAKKATDPLFVDQAAELIDVLRPQTPAQVASLMELSDALATAVTIKLGAKNKGELVIAFGDLDQLDGVIARLKVTAD